MLLKSKDDIAGRQAELTELLKLRISASQRTAIVRERALLHAGFRAEKDAAFEIDFRIKDHKYWTIIHDLRLEHKGRVAQIDHLIFHPNWEFYVVETKGIHTKLDIRPGQWSFLRNDEWQGMANPVEQNARHIMVLKEILRDFDLLPRTMGIPVLPRFINVVLVPPECLIRQQEEVTWVLHMDEFVTKARWDLGVGNLILNLIHSHSSEEAAVLGNKLVALHRPFKIDYRKRFGVPPIAECDQCGKVVEPRVMKFCQNNTRLFGGRVLCRGCQNKAKEAALGKV
jgi:hypothetical protein